GGCARGENARKSHRAMSHCLQVSRPFPSSLEIGLIDPLRGASASFKVSRRGGTMPPRLKVFQAHLGFFDTVVAAPSRAAALKAWGSRQDLFRDGQARPASDPGAIAAALAKPGLVLRRPVGSNVA